MKSIIIAMMVFLAAGAAAIPIPTSVFGTIISGDYTVKIAVYNETATMHNLETTSDQGSYAVVFATEGITHVDIEMEVYQGQELLFNQTYPDIETGSKLNVDLSFWADTPAARTNVEKSGTGGGTNEPTIEDIPRLREELDPEPAQHDEPDDPVDEPEQPGQPEQPEQPVVELPAAVTDNSLLIIGAIILVILMIIMILSERAKHE